MKRESRILSASTPECPILIETRLLRRLGERESAVPYRRAFECPETFIEPPFSQLLTSAFPSRMTWEGQPTPAVFFLLSSWLISRLFCRGPPTRWRITLNNSSVASRWLSVQPFLSLLKQRSVRRPPADVVRLLNRPYSTVRIISVFPHLCKRRFSFPDFLKRTQTYWCRRSRRTCRQVLRRRAAAGRWLGKWSVRRAVRNDPNDTAGNCTLIRRNCLCTSKSGKGIRSPLGRPVDKRLRC